jgi:Serine hydrolase (FSH1)
VKIVYLLQANLASLQTEEPDTDSERKNARSWWQIPSGRPSQSVEYVGWEVTYDQLVDALRKHQPVHGVLGMASEKCSKIYTMLLGWVCAVFLLLFSSAKCQR